MLKIIVCELTKINEFLQNKGYKNYYEAQNGLLYFTKFILVWQLIFITIFRWKICPQIYVENVYLHMEPQINWDLFSKI